MTNVRIFEVSPRDGLQSEAKVLDTTTKLKFIQLLVNAGLREIEVAAFVRPDRVPQLADGDLVCSRLPHREDRNFFALVPNRKGFIHAQRAGIRGFSLLCAATETFCQKNLGCSLQESLTRCRDLVKQAQRSGSVRIRGYISCAFGCPYEGKVEPGKVADLAGILADCGCDKIVLADTIGIATVSQIREVIKAVSRQLPATRLALHLHDTRGQALVNVFVGLEQGIETIDSSVAGLGGCPFAPGAAGNLATEDLVYMLEGEGVDTRINLDALINAGRWISHQLECANRSRVGSGILLRQAS